MRLGDGAVVERLDVKQALVERVERATGDSTIVSSNTSGIPLSSIAEGRTVEFRRRWLGTHFFNPPRYLTLLEVIVTADTDPAVVRTIVEFADRRLGKGVVLAKDTGFIANRIGIFGLMQVFKAMSAAGLGVEDVDAMTGPRSGARRARRSERWISRAWISSPRWRGTSGSGSIRRAARLCYSARRRRVGPAWLDRFQGRPRLPEAGVRRHRSARFRADGVSAVFAPSAIDAARTVEDPAQRIGTLFKDPGKVGGFLRARWRQRFSTPRRSRIR